MYKIILELSVFMEQVRAGFDESSGLFEIHTDIAYKRGNQVFISYGPHDNTKLLLEYGFILPENQHTEVKIYRGNQKKSLTNFP